MSLRTYPLGKECEADVVSGLPVRRLTDIPGTQFHFPYFTNNPFPEPRQVICFSEPTDAQWGEKSEKTLYVADLETDELRQVSRPIESKDRWMAVCGLVAAREGNRAFWATDNRVLSVDLLRGEVEEIYRSPEGWGMGQSNCTAKGDVFSVGETKSDFMSSEPKHDGYTLDRKAQAWPEPTARIVLVDAATGQANVGHELNGVPSHVNVHPFDPNLVLYCHEGQWSYVGHRIWLLDVAAGEARPICKPPEGYAFGHETWTDDGRVLFHGANLQLRPEDQPGGTAPPLECLIGTGPTDGTVDRMYIDTRMRWGVPHVIMSSDGKWITTAGHWARDLIWVSPWGEEELRPRPVAVHQGEGAGTICPRFFPDGKAIVFVGPRGDTSQLYCVDLEN